MFKQKLAAGILGLAMVLPMIASADTTTDAQNQIQTLLNQIKTLQEQIRTIISSNPGIVPGHHDGNGTTTPQGDGNGGTPCFMPMRALGMGAKGDDVKNLQEWLRGEDGFSGVSTGFFGSQTAKALARWQQRNGISSSSVGTVGPRTQDFFKKRCEGRDDHGQKGGMMMNMPAHIAGSITTTNGNDITVVNGDGRIVVVHVTGTTTIKVWSSTSTPAVTGSLSDLIVGKKVAADGPKGADGSITAVHITVGTMLPKMDMPGMMGGHMDDNDSKTSDSYTHGAMGGMMGDGNGGSKNGPGSDNH